MTKRLTERRASIRRNAFGSMQELAAQQLERRASIRRNAFGSMQELAAQQAERRAPIRRNAFGPVQGLAEQRQRSFSTCPEASAKEMELMAQTKEVKAQAPIFEYQEKPIYVLVAGVNMIAALLGLILVAPLMLVIAIAIKLFDLHAPVLYRGRRIGKLGKPFTILKFRTMAPGAEQRIGARLISKDSSLVTALGRSLRKYKLDELPQLVNVLRGEMRLVGPRPAREVFLEELRARIPGYDRRFLVEPGITGLAQLRGGYYTDPKNKLRYELLYIRRWSLRLDLNLIAATLLMLVFQTPPRSRSSSLRPKPIGGNGTASDN